jgi:hypothetical protein
MMAMAFHEVGKTEVISQEEASVFHFKAGC